MGATMGRLVLGRHLSISQPGSRTGENPPYGILGGTMETSASFEARSAPSPYPTTGMKQRMENSYEKGPAICLGPESCAATARDPVKRRQGYRRGGLWSCGMSRKRKRKADVFSGR
jgi:hypothetical protein